MKQTAIMVESCMPLERLDPSLLEVVLWVARQVFRGVDSTHHARWERGVRRLLKRAGVWTFYPEVERDGRFHRMHMAMESRIYANQDGNFRSKKWFRIWLKTGAAFGHFEASAGVLVFVPSSLDYEDCSDDQMREFHEDAIEFLRSPEALERLWPRMRERDRHDTLEQLLRNPQNPNEGDQR